MPHHTDIAPDECVSCTSVFGVLQDAIGERLTVAAIGERSGGLVADVARRHLAHLVHHNKIKTDRRTPVKGATVGPQPHPYLRVLSPVDWAASVATPDRTCGRCLRAYAERADRYGVGQAGTDEIAEALSISLRTAGTHRRDLVRAELIQFTPVFLPLGDGQWERRPDTFTLLSGHRATASPDLPYTVDEIAHNLVVSLEWWPHPLGHSTSLRATWLVADFLRDGWPDSALRILMERPIEERVFNPYGLLRKRLPKRGTPYVVPAMEHVSSVQRRIRCPRCGLPFVEFTVPVGTLCNECVAEEAILRPRTSV